MMLTTGKRFVVWLVLPLLAIAFFIVPIVHNRVLVPGDIVGVVDDVWAAGQPAKNPLLSDVVFQFYPWQSFLFQRLHAGELPLWNPDQLTGTPFLANDQSAIFDPIRLLTWLAGFSAAGSFLPAAILRLGLFGVCVALWLRRRVGTSVAMMIGATAMMVVPYIAWLSYPLFASFLWLPLILLGIDLLPVRRLPGGALIALGLAGSLVGGNIQMSLFLTLFVAAYALVMMPRPQWKLSAWALGAVLAGTLLAAVQLLPSLNFIRQSPVYASGRSGYAQTSFLDAVRHGQWNGWHSWSEVKQEMKRLLPVAQPEIFGNPATNSYRPPDQTSQNNFNELAVSIGLGGLILALFGAVTAWGERLVRYSTLAIGVMVGVVSHAPVFELLNYLPIIRQTSTGRFRFFIAFGLLVLAAYGLRTLMGTMSARQRRWLFGSGLVVGLMGLGLMLRSPNSARLSETMVLIGTIIAIGIASWPTISRPVRGLVLGAMLIVPGFFMFRGYNTSVRADALFPPNPAVTAITAAANQGRIVGIAGADRRVPVLPNGAMIFGWSDIRGYEVARLNRFDQLTTDLFRRAGSYLRSVNHPDPLLNVLGVETGLIQTAGQAAMIRDFQNAGWQTSGSAGGLTLLHNPAAWPRAYFINQPQQVAGAAAAWQSVKHLQQLANTVIETGQTVAPTELSATTPAPIISQSANQVTLQLIAPSAGYVVLMDAFDEGWRATVNEQAAQVQPANYAFRAVAVPAGQLTIKFFYRPVAFVTGAWISGVSLGVGLVWAGWIVFNRRRSIPASR